LGKFASFNKVGQFFRSISGWIWFLGIGVPMVGTFVTSLLEGKDWSYIIFVTIGVASFAMFFIYHGIKGWDYAAAKIGTKAERARILKDIDDYKNSGLTRIDLPTAAAIWAGTLEQGNVNRHLCFRKLKAAVVKRKMNPIIDGQYITNGIFGFEINKNTEVLLDDLKKYFEDEIFK